MEHTLSDPFFQNPLTYADARKFFDNNHPSFETTLQMTCSAYGYMGLYLQETSQTTPNAYRNGFRLSSKARFYMDQLQSTLFKVPPEQKFFFNITPGLAAQGEIQNYGVLLDILEEFNKVSGHRGATLFVTQLLMFRSGSTTAELAVLVQFSFREAADAMRFKLTYC